MTFVPGNPKPNDTLGQSRPTIQGNLDSLFTTLNKNHTSPNAPNSGTHTHVDLLTQAANPDPGPTIVSHFSKTVAGQTEWFFQREGTVGPVVPGAAIQMSGGTATNVGVYPNSKGTTFLPGGLQVKWGSTNVPGGSVSGSVTAVFVPLGLGNFPTNVFSAWLSCNAAATDSPILTIFSLTTSQIIIAYEHSPTTAFTAFWWIIGN